jgi:aldehyde dehydrogenase (NAD+)
MSINVKTYSGEVGADTDVVEITRLIDLQRGFAPEAKATNAKQRIAFLKKLEKSILNSREAIRQAAYADFRKAPDEMDLTEVYPTLIELRSAMRHLADWMEPTPVDQPITYIGSTSDVVYEAKGNCLVIAPWNYPFQLNMIPIISAIAAGNTVILKPSEFTPHVSEITVKILAEVFDEQHVAVVQGGISVSQFLLEQKWDHIHFTGSPKVGKIVMEAASKHLSDITLELGGKSPCIIEADANLKDAARKIAWGKLVNAGQTCIAPDFVLIDEKVELEFLQLLRQAVENLYGQDIIDSADYCRIINTRNFDRIERLKREALENGAELVFGGKSEESQLFIEPTVIRKVSSEMEIMQEEIFGPLLPVFSFSNRDDGLKIIREREKPLAIYIFGKKKKWIDYWLANTSAGGTCINDVLIHISQPHLPFGGVNNSGIGKSHGRWGFISFSNERSVLRQSNPYSAGKLLFPPYTKLKQKIINLSIKWF